MVIRGRSRRHNACMLGTSEGDPMSTAAATSPATSATDKSIWSMVKQTFKDWSEDKAMRLAAAMACYVMLALATMLVIFVKVLGVVYKERTDEVVQSQLD